jgi:hypothetical protein
MFFRRIILKPSSDLKSYDYREILPYLNFYSYKTYPYNIHLTYYPYGHFNIYSPREISLICVFLKTHVEIPFFKPVAYLNIKIEKDNKNLKIIQKKRQDEIKSLIPLPKDIVNLIFTFIKEDLQWEILKRRTFKKKINMIFQGSNFIVNNKYLFFNKKNWKVHKIVYSFFKPNSDIPIDIKEHIFNKRIIKRLPLPYLRNHELCFLIYAERV